MRDTESYQALVGLTPPREITAAQMGLTCQKPPLRIYPQDGSHVKQWLKRQYRM